MPGPDRRHERRQRCLDLVGAVLLLLVSSPVLALAVILIRLDSPGPAIFRSLRVGKDGRVFALYKFRTMFTGAEALLPALASRNVGGERFIRIPNDPRVTRVGRLLRLSSLDELPQLVNVARGEMSLVGPRPQATSEVALYSAEERRRLAVRPGLTGLWQVRAWDSLSFDDWIRYDLEYIRRRSLWLDLKILVETPWALLMRMRRTGRRSLPASARSKEGSRAG